MNTNTIIGLVVAIVVVGGGAWYLNTNSNGTLGENTGSTSEEGESGVSSFASLIAMGGSRTCTVTVSDGGATSEGTIYVSDGKVRGDFTVSSDGQTYTGHMIQADGYVYNWSDAIPQGMKMRIDAQGEATQQSQATIDPDAQVDYDCSMWVTDQSKFAVPSNITFMELGASTGIPNVPQGMMRGY